METFSALLAICAGNSPVTSEFHTQRPVTRSFDLHPNKRLSKQWWGWWFEALSCPLWRHLNEMANICYINNMDLVSIFRCCLTGLGIPIIRIRRSRDCLIFLVPEKTFFVLNRGPVFSSFIHSKYDGAMAFKRFLHDCHLVRGNHRSPMDSPPKGTVIRKFDIVFFVSTNKMSTNNRNAGDLRRNDAHVMSLLKKVPNAKPIMKRILRAHNTIYWRICIKPQGLTSCCRESVNTCVRWTLF